jgi:predicted CxxxxCH...CXXCH cytochrome family protein
MTFRSALAALSALTAALALSACESRARPVDDLGGAVSACTTCHGDPARVASDPLVRAAPPVSPTGDGGGGAHLAHLAGGTFRAPLACDECHDVPATADHVDGVLEVPMSLLARARDAAPAWDPANATCSGVYCHGATLGGGPTETPSWSSSPALGCSSCHGYPPPSHDAGATACEDCHLGTVKPGGALDLEAGRHLDGRLDLAGLHAEGYEAPTLHGRDANAVGVTGCKSCHGDDLAGGSVGVSCNACHADAGFPAWATTCTFCHGTAPGGPASPPVDTQGRTVTTNVSVGVHASHVATTIATPLACTQCHPDRSGSNVITDAQHVDGNGVAEVALGALARTGGAAATYTRASATSATCASTYCHGRFSGGANSGAGATVNWTSTTQVTCTSCHGSAPGTGEHSKHASRMGCYICHFTVVDSTRAVVNPALHVNGSKNVSFGGTYDSRAVTGTWNATNRSCSISCHSGESW